MNLPRCHKCNDIPSAVIGLPVVVSLSDEGTATVTTDLSEVDTDYELVCRCPSTPGDWQTYGPTLSSEEIDQITSLLTQIANHRLPAEQIFPLEG